MLVLLASAAAVSAFAAHADLPSPLFCTPMEMCQTDGTCAPVHDQPPFVLRRTEDAWVMRHSPRGTERWVVMADSVAAARADAPEGALIAVVFAGQTEGGDIILEEHVLRPTTGDEGFTRSHCETEGAAAS